jgi:hypothetical protein
VRKKETKRKKKKERARERERKRERERERERESKREKVLSSSISRVMRLIHQAVRSSCNGPDAP